MTVCMHHAHPRDLLAGSTRLLPCVLRCPLPGLAALLPKLESELRRGAQVLSYMFRWAQLLQSVHCDAHVICGSSSRMHVICGIPN